MANSEHVEIVKRGKDAVDAWRRAHPGERLDLSQANLSLANLSGAILNEANLSEANLFMANLIGAYLDQAYLIQANLSHADLSEADLSGANLSGAILDQARLRKAHLSAANLDQADLSEAELDQANLSLANLSGAILFMAILREANLSEANLDQADLGGANLSQANLSGANLSGANLSGVELTGADATGARHLVLDRCIVNNRAGTRFSPRAGDPWSVLRRTYTGTAFAFHLLLLVAFVLPIIARTAFWVSANKAQEQLRAHLAPVVEDAVSEGKWYADRLKAAVEALRPEESGRSYSVGELVIGADRGPGALVLTLVLIVYNLFRGLLTRFVGPLREEEERSGVSPEYRGRNGYRWLYAVHRVAFVLFWFGALSFAGHAIYWLSRPVWLPG